MTADERFKEIGYEPMSDEELMNFAEHAKDCLLELELKKYKPLKAYHMTGHGFVIIIHDNCNVVVYDYTGVATCLELKEIEAVHYLYKELGLLNEVENG